jgi:hypothetical protein
MPSWRTRAPRRHLRFRHRVEDFYTLAHDDGMTEDQERRARFDAARLRYERAAAALAAGPGVVDLDMLSDDELIVIDDGLSRMKAPD